MVKIVKKIVMVNCQMWKVWVQKQSTFTGLGSLDDIHNVDKLSGVVEVCECRINKRWRGSGGEDSRHLL